MPSINDGVFPGLKRALGRFREIQVDGVQGALNPSRYRGATQGGSPTSGTFRAGDWILDLANAVVYTCTASGAPGTWQSRAGLLLSSVQYAPGTNAAYSTSSVTLVALDTTNLTISFTAPVSGAVIVSLSAVSIPGSRGNWGLLTHGSSTPVGSTMFLSTSGVNIGYVFTVRQKITGLTPGTIYQWDWAQASAISANISTYAQGISQPTSSSTGPAVMEVWSA